MKLKFCLFMALALTGAFGLTRLSHSQQKSPPDEPIELPKEKHLRNVKQLSFAGENAEAYFNGDGTELIFQSKRDGRACDQIYRMKADGTQLNMVSTGMGTTTCSYIFPNGKKILYASTHLGNPNCPTPPDRSKGYVWAIYPDFDIFVANPDGTKPEQ